MKIIIKLTLSFLLLLSLDGFSHATFMENFDGENATNPAPANVFESPVTGSNLVITEIMFDPCSSNNATFTACTGGGGTTLLG